MIPRGNAASHRRLGVLSRAAALCALAYAVYRAYYGFGGTVGMFGVPASEATWRAINLGAVALLLGAAALPLVALPLWRTPRAREVLLVVAWVIAVACIGHALINDLQRILSLAGLLDIQYPPGMWLTIDRRAADLQDLLFNETWFLIEGFLWAAIAWVILEHSPTRRWWIASAIAAVGMATLFGMLSAFGVIERVVIG